MSEDYSAPAPLLNDAAYALSQLAAAIVRRDLLEDKLANSTAPTWGELRQLQVLDSLVLARHAVAQALVNQVNDQLLNSEKYVRGLARVAGVKAREEVVQ